MARTAFGLLVACVVTAGVSGGDDTPVAAPAARLKQLRARYEEVEATFRKELLADRSDAGVSKANEKYNQASREWRREALAALRASGDGPEAFEVIAAILRRSSVEVAEMTDLLRKHHAARPDLGKLFHDLVQEHQGRGRAFVEEMAEKSPVTAVRGQAAFALGWQSKWRITQDGDENLGFEKALNDDERQQLQARAEKYLTRALAYKGVPMASGRGTVEENARADLAGLKNLPNLRVGKVAPDLVGETVEGAKLKLSDSRGKVTVVVFWASWCGPCMRMVPHEQKLVERMRGKPFALVGVNGDDDRAKARDVAREKGMTWPSLWNAGEGPDGPLDRAWNVHVWPTIYVLDARGVVRYTGHSDARLDALVDELVAELEKR